MLETTSPPPVTTQLKIWGMRQDQHAALEVSTDGGLLHVSVEGLITTVPLAALHALTVAALAATSQGLSQLNQLRLDHSSDLLSQLGLQVTSTRAGTVAARPGVTPHADGTPHLRWVPQADLSSSPQAWQLIVAGFTGGPLGTATWDDAAELTGLTQSLDDPDTLLAMAGLLGQDASASLAARMTARTLRSAGKLPTHNARAVCDALLDAGLGSPAGTRDYQLGTVKALNLRTGDANVNVAVSVLRTLPTFSTPGWTHYSQPTDEMRERTSAYRAQVTQVMAAAGYRPVDLQTTGYRHLGTAMFFTRLPDAVWQSILPAVLTRLKTFQPNDGGSAL
jgi:hypothetical protein